MQIINTESLYNELKKRVIGQDELLKALSVMGYKHQKNIELNENGLKTLENNILIAGNSGSGKTLAVTELAKIINVPVFTVDCTKISQHGYQGTSLDQIIDKMVDQLGSENASRCIVFLDEIDKIKDSFLEKKYDSFGCQQDFLKIIEKENTKNDNSSSSMTHRNRFSNKTVTFVAAGSFEAVKNKIRETGTNSNARKNVMGFMTGESGNSSMDDDIVLTSDDLISNGYLPELIGRFQTIVNIRKLNEEDLYQIASNSGSSIVKQYETMFGLDGVALEISDDYYRHLAAEANRLNVGARGLTNALNKELNQCVFDISSNSRIEKVLIDYRNNEPKIEYCFLKDGETRKNNNGIELMIPFKMAIEKMRVVTAVYSEIFSLCSQVKRSLNEDIQKLYSKRTEVGFEEMRDYMDSRMKEENYRSLSGKDASDEKTIYMYMTEKTRVYTIFVDECERTAKRERNARKEQNR